MKKIGQAVLIGGIFVFLGFCILMAGAFLGYFQSKGKATNKSDNSQWIEKEYQCDNITEISNIEILLVDEEVKFEAIEPLTSITNTLKNDITLTIPTTKSITHNTNATDHIET